MAEAHENFTGDVQGVRLAAGTDFLTIGKIEWLMAFGEYLLCHAGEANTRPFDGAQVDDGQLTEYLQQTIFV